MATATTQDDDLLIIADDSASEDNIEFSFDFDDNSTEKTETPTTAEVETQVVSESTDIPKMGIDILEETTETPETSDAPEVTDDATIDLGIDFDAPVAQETKDEIKAETHEVEAHENFSFNIDEAVADKAVETREEVSQTSETITEIAVPTGSSGDDTSMNDILSATIAQLAARKEAISTDKSSKSQSEEEIKAKIKELQAQVKDLEADMAILDSESDKITENIAELENMKLDPVKEHNAKRAKK